MVKCILKYLKNVENNNFLFDGLLDNDRFLLGCVDDAQKQNLNQRQYITWYVYKLGSKCITWRSILEKCKAQSTTEIKYVVIIEVANETI